ncbi:MAG: hypothetical protein GY757_59000, partial [bacterium]|nr:hypothetical protein [bacterium]
IGDEEPENGSYVKAGNIENTVFGSSFDLLVEGKNTGRLKLNVGGLHNISNALAAICACLEIGIEVPVIREGFKRFYLPARRFQVLFYEKDYVVIDDYAHHPREIEATLDTLAQGDFKRIIAVFQPHRFTRLEKLMDHFTTCFGKAQQLIISEIYGANQDKIENIDSPVLEAKIKASGFKDVRYIDTFDGILQHLGETIKKGDAVVFLSAGNLTRAAQRFAKLMEDYCK